MTDSVRYTQSGSVVKNCVIYSQPQSLQKVEYFLLSITFIYVIRSCVVLSTLHFDFLYLSNRVNYIEVYK